MDLRRRQREPQAINVNPAEFDLACQRSAVVSARVIPSRSRLISVAPRRADFAEPEASARSSSVATAISTATALALFTAPSALARPSTHPFAIEQGSFHIRTTTERGIPNPIRGDEPPFIGVESIPTTQAGEHETLTVEFQFEHESGLEEKTYNDVRTANVNLPPGFVGNNTAVPTCLDSQLSNEFTRTGGEWCPPDSQVGTIELSIDLLPNQSTVSASRRPFSICRRTVELPRRLALMSLV